MPGAQQLESTRSVDEELALFPLHTVLLPGGLLQLKIFEARYLDLISRSLREGSGFGVVALQAGDEVRRSDGVVLESVGCLAELIDCDAPGPGLLHVRCRGSRRFELSGPARQRADGLWCAPVRYLPEEAPTEVPDTLARTAEALGEALEQLEQQGVVLHLPPLRLADALWVAYRWCELLPLSNRAKLALMQLDDPLARLQTVDHILRQHALDSDAASEADSGATNGSADDPDAAGPATLH